MKKILISGLLGLSALQARAALVAAYTFDENSGTIAADAVRGVTGNATLSATGATFAVGQIGNALTLNGTTGYAWAYDPVLTGATNLSVSAWVYANTAPSFATIVKNWSGAFHFGLGSGGTLGKLSNYLNGSGTDTVAAPTTLTLNAWHQVAFTYDGVAGLHKLYIDGLLVATDNSGVAGSLSVAATTMGIGVKLGTGDATTPADSYWNGRIDDLAFYDNTLTDSDISTIYANGLAGVSVVSVVPEPSTYGLLGAGTLAAVAFVRRRRKFAA